MAHVSVQFLIFPGRLSLPLSILTKKRQAFCAKNRFFAANALTLQALHAIVENH